MQNCKWRFSFPLITQVTTPPDPVNCWPRMGANTFIQKIQSHRSTCLFDVCSIYSIYIYSKKTDHISTATSLVDSILSTLSLKLLFMLLKVGIKWAREYKKSLAYYHTVGKLTQLNPGDHWIGGATLRSIGIGCTTISLICIVHTTYLH
jgi:hypothetical protein